MIAPIDAGCVDRPGRADRGRVRQCRAGRDPNAMAPILLLSLWLPGMADAPPAAVPAVSGTTRMLGELALARGALAFAPCGAEAAPARGAGAAAGAAAVVAALNGGADGSVFADADVVREADGRWRIDRVRRAYRRGLRCGEDLGEFVWRGAAHDAGWTFNVSRRYVALRRPGEPALFFRYRPFEQAADGSWRFTAPATDARFEAILRAERCATPDGTSLSDWSLTVTLDGETSAGCAWGGEPR